MHEVGSTIISDILKLELDTVDIVLLETLFCRGSLVCEELCSEGTYSDSLSLHASSSLSSKNKGIGIYKHI